ncbi:adenylate/guanylate cyclase domain-containing protein [Desulfosporosinus lacus]|uniref:Adenylate cyclase, class 3 n=1 Tax=Desulfosporosinus lacus DSM 15449 TaxID=1121420 RepID=A0A1M5QQV5_9FIRM|nr:adenylate/guanylate cyclase domain-containing protein [Desulfosporosinus lacus]SHH16169.1 Adenylate cyclase, class 3 [Desulfosporosinus lacus DSM 15449]
MGLKEELYEEIKRILDYDLQVTNLKRIPSKGDLTLGETAAKIRTAVLFTDIRNSSIYADTHWQKTTSKTINAFLNCALRIVKKNNGEVRSFNGDSLLALFDPNNSPCTGAVTSAMELIWAVRNIIAPSVCEKGYIENFDIGIGISFGDILCSRVGIRGEDNNDLIWTSSTTNLAAKMGNQASKPFNIIIDNKVWESIPNKLKLNETRLLPQNKYEGLTQLTPTFPRLTPGPALSLRPPLLPFRTSYWEGTIMPFAKGLEKVYKTSYMIPLS